MHHELALILTARANGEAQQSMEEAVNSAVRNLNSCLARIRLTALRLIGQVLSLVLVQVLWTAAS